jgi:anthranilate synthase/aminodeoxychorismate synthase-like glutamine amidotransferase
MKILVIDNYDSFTFNLVQLVGMFTDDIVVKRNDELTIEEIKEIGPDKIIISPGPGRPENSNISLDVIKYFGKSTPILGVCLGHQGIGQIFGCKITNAPILMHGKISNVTHDNKTIFKNIPQNFEAGRYHSLIIDRESLNGDLEITSETEDKIIMGIRHKKYPIEGIQFHPESILTPEGVNLIKNWIEL